MTIKLIKVLVITLSLFSYGCSVAEDEHQQRSVTIMDRGLGIPLKTYTFIPEGYQISGYKTTDHRGLSGDSFEIVTGPDGRRRITAASILMVSGDMNQLLRYAAGSIQTALQRAGESGTLTTNWSPVTTGTAMKALQAEFATPDGRVGVAQFYYQTSGNSASGYPVIMFSQPDDFEAFGQELVAINNGVQTNPQWSVAQQQTARGGIQQLNTDHKNRMAASQANFDAGQRAQASRQAGFDQANAQWRDNFNSGWSTGSTTPSDSGHSNFLGMISETERFNDPSTGYDRQLDAGYSHTYTNGLGGYYQTNDHFLNPNSMQGNWYETQPNNW